MRYCGSSPTGGLVFRYSPEPIDRALIVDFAVVWIGAGAQVLLAAEFEQLDAVARADLVSEVVEEFEHREGLLRRPIGRDFEVLKSDEFSFVFLRRLRFGDGRRPIAL